VNIMLGWQEILIIFIVLLLLFGGKRLPELAKGLGKAVREFRDASTTPPKPEKKKQKARSPKKLKG